MFLYQTNALLKIIDFSLIKQLNDLNTSYECFGYVTECLLIGLQIRHRRNIIPYKHCLIQQPSSQVFSLSHPWVTRLIEVPQPTVF